MSPSLLKCCWPLLLWATCTASQGADTHTALTQFPQMYAAFLLTSVLGRQTTGPLYELLSSPQIGGKQWLEINLEVYYIILRGTAIVMSTEHMLCCEKFKCSHNFIYCPIQVSNFITIIIYSSCSSVYNWCRICHKNNSVLGYLK